LRWKQLIKNYFVCHSRGSTEDIRNWIYVTHFDLVKEDIVKWITKVCNEEPHYLKFWKENLHKQCKLDKLTTKKIYSSHPQIMFHLKNFVKLRILKKEDNYSGLSKYNFVKIKKEVGSK